jgi:hypothetical protein
MRSRFAAIVLFSIGVFIVVTLFVSVGVLRWAGDAGRMEAAEMEQLALRGKLRRAEERSEGLREELERETSRAEPAGRRGQAGPAWRRWLGGR